MNTKLLIALAAILALTQVEAQGAPALTSLSSKIESIESSLTGGNRTPLLSSASSAYSRISAGIASSAASASATQSSSLASDSSSASMASSSASNAQSSASEAQSSANSALSSSTASASAAADSSNAANALAGSNSYAVQLSALAAVFIASFIAIIA
ncbi:hypothetical protein BD408DRAFT_426671 [Parasitella parasitica]|nr:hypothetical protein BD408DRAFT_426671 [Parasitella parasitica]